MEPGEPLVDTSRLRRRVILGYRHATGLLESESPNNKLEGIVYDIGYKGQQLADGLEATPLFILAFRFTQIVGLAAARRAGWSEKAIQETLEQGRRYAQDEALLMQTTGENAFMAYTNDKLEKDRSSIR